MSRFQNRLHLLRDRWGDVEDFRTLHPYWTCAIVSALGFLLGWVLR